VETADRGVDLAFGAMQAADAAEQVREALQITGFLELGAVHDWREAHHFGPCLAMPCDQRGETLHNIFIERGARIDAVIAHPVKQDIDEMIERMGCLRRKRGRIGSDRGVHHCLSVLAQSRREAGTPLIRLDVAMLLRIRSLLIIRGEESTSRSSRPTLNSP